MPFSLPRLLSKLQSIITIDTANNDLRIANAVVFPDGTRQTTAGVAVDAFARETANGANGLAQGAYDTANGVNSFTQGAYDKANGAYNQANTATGIAQASFNTANTAYNDAIYLQGINNNQNTSISIIEGVNLWQNTEITAVNTFAGAAFNRANNNTNHIAIIEGVDFTQNADIIAINQYAQSAYAEANVSVGVNATQNTRLDSIETINTNQNTSISIIEGVNVTQNNNIIAINQYATSAYDKANNGGLFTGNVTVGQDLYVTGNLTVSGNVTSVSATDLIVNDPLIYLANNNLGNLWDIGLVGNFDNGTYQHTGLVRDATDSQWKLFSNVVAEPTNTVDFTYAIYDDIRLGTVTGNVVANTVVVNGIDLRSVQNTQNTNITAVNDYAVSAYGQANTNSNTITLVNQFAQSAYNQANTGTVLAQAAFDKANTGGSSAGLAGWTVIDNNYTVSNNVQLIANTTVSGFTVTLPSSPVTGNTVVITDGSLVTVGWANNGVTVARNGSTILGYADDLFLNVSRSTATLVYDGGTWQVSSTVGPKGDTGTAGPAGATGSPGPAGAGANATQRVYRFTATNNQTIFIGSDAYSQTLSYNVNAVSVYLNGVYLRPADDYVANNGTTIYLTTGTFANDALDVVSFESMSLTAAQNTITTYVYTASNNQTSFGGADNNGKVLDYNYNNIFVTLNGLNLRSGVDYLQSNTSYITLTSGAVANDELSIVAFGSFSVQGTNTQNTISSYYYTSTAGQTNFSGADIYGKTLSYMQDGLFVVRNGATLRNKIDYTATDGTTVSLATPTAANDEIAITAVGWFSVAANGYTQVEANNLFLTKTDANNIFASTADIDAVSANTYTKEQANTQFLAQTGGTVTGNTFFNANTFFNSTIFTRGIVESANIVAGFPGANTTFNLLTQAVLYYTANNASNTTLNIRGSATVPLNSLMSTGNTATIALLVTNSSANTFWPNVVQIDGIQVTPKWQGGTTVTAGNANSIDAYGYTIIKTGNATYTVLASQTKYA